MKTQQVINKINNHRKKSSMLLSQKSHKIKVRDNCQISYMIYLNDFYNQYFLCNKNK